jgi:hypothetical protein
LAPNIEEMRIGGVRCCVLGRLPADKIPRIESCCLSILKESRLGLNLEDLIAQVQTELADSTIDDEFVGSVIRACPNIRMWNGGWMYHVRHPSTPRLIETARILRSAAQPMHFTAIATKLNDRMTWQSSPRAVHGFLGRNSDVFARVGPGTYELRHGGSIP